MEEGRMLAEILEQYGLTAEELHRQFAGRARWQTIRGPRFDVDCSDYRFRCTRCGALTPERGYPIAPDWCHGCGARMN